MATLILVGCGSGGSNKAASPATSNSGADPESPLRVVESGALTLTSRRDDGKVAWVLNGKSSRTLFTDDGAERQVVLEGVSGEMMDEQGTASTFTAAEGTASANDNRVVASDATVKSARDDIELSTSTLRWMEDRRLFAAEGNVWLKGKGWTLGPAPVLWATPDLKKVGTPDKFEE